jgi:hypothetical protein
MEREITFSPGRFLCYSGAFKKGVIIERSLSHAG